jgi:hypothetical protein
MALTIDKSGKVINKHLTTPIEEIKKALQNHTKEDMQKQVLQKVVKMKFNRVIAS